MDPDEPSQGSGKHDTAAKLHPAERSAPTGNEVNGNSTQTLLMAPLAAHQNTSTQERQTPGHPGVMLEGVPRMIAKEEARELHGWYPSDKRRPISERKLEFPGVDFSEVGMGVVALRPACRAKQCAAYCV